MSFVKGLKEGFHDFGNGITNIVNFILLSIVYFIGVALTSIIAKIIGKPLNYEMVDFHSDRPGHDLRYGLDGSKMENMGWKLPINFESSLENTVLWTLENKNWLL